MRIKVQGLSRRFGKTLAVDQVSFDVPEGAILGLIGRNGAGKTTLLKLMAGVLKPDAGEVRLDGELQEPKNLEARRSLGWVPDAPILFGTLSAREHLAFLAQVHRLTDWERRAEALFEELDFTADADSVTSGLSLGTQQRASLACAFLHEPRILLLDEPLNALDPLARRRVQDHLARRAREGAAVVVSSHQLDAVQEIATHVAILDGGRLVLQGSAAELLVPGTTLESLFLRTSGAQGRA